MLVLLLSFGDFDLARRGLCSGVRVRVNDPGGVLERRGGESSLDRFVLELPSSRLFWLVAGVFFSRDLVSSKKPDSS